VLPFPKPTKAQAKELKEYREKLNAWMDKHLDPDKIDRDADIGDEVIKGLGKLGVLSCTIAKEHGGLEFSQYMYCKAVEDIARRCASTGLFVNAHQSIGLKALLLYGTPEQQDQFLKPLAKGEMLAAFALTEKNAGSDAAGVETTAHYDADRDVYIINGSKQWITNGGVAGVLTLMARTMVNGKDKISAFLVTPDMPGFEVTDVALEKCGMRGTKTAKLKFTNMEVPAKNILGEPGRGLHIALHVLDFGRTTFGATCTGAAKYCLERSLAHVKDRVQFKQSIGNFQSVKQKIAKMAAYTYAMEAMTELTAGLVDRGEEDYMLETAMLKVFSSDHQWQILSDTMQLFGGRSFFTDEPFERMMRDARLNTIGEGSNDVLRTFIGLVGMRDVGMKFKDVADGIKSPTLGIGKMFGLGKEMMRKFFVTPHVPVHSAELKDEAHKLGERVRQFGLAVQKLIVHYQEDVLDAHAELDRIGNAAMNIYGMTAVLGKLDGRIERKECTPEELSAGQYYCELAIATIDENLGALISDNNDKSTFKTADLLMKLEG